MSYEFRRSIRLVSETTVAGDSIDLNADTGTLLNAN